jgi:uncharacterized SAM-dependent methyltransferase
MYLSFRLRAAAAGQDIFTGSSMGNLNKIEAWGDTWASTDDILLRACDDSLGVTAAFNLNLLERTTPNWAATSG